MATFAEKMAMWQSSSAPLTPEAQARKLKQAKLEQQQAVKVARARAARYNMTLRALSIQTIREQADQKKQDYNEMLETRRRAEKYNMTSRAIAIASAKTQASVASALDPRVDPEIARQVVEAAAGFQATADKDLLSSEKAQASKAADMLGVAIAVEKAAEEDQDLDESVEAASSGASQDEEGDESNLVVMDELAAAVATGDEEGVNRAILKNFLEEHAPERVGEVDELLKEYEGSKVEVLFQELVSKYPDPVAAERKGEAVALDKAMERTSVEGELEADDEEVEEEEVEEEDEEEEEEEQDLVEEQRRAAAAAEAREEEKIAGMSADERARYFADKQAEKDHAAKKDAMLKSQLGLYAKGGNKKNPVLAGMASKITSRSSVDKRLSKKVESVGGARPTGKKSIVGDGFILSAKVESSEEAGQRSSLQASGRPNGSAKESKWAVDVQVNAQPHVLRERMKKAGVEDKDIDALLAEESDML